MKYLILFLAALSVSISKPIDTVYSFTPGTGQNNGQSAEYYPNNIFGLPSINASYDVPATDPNEVLSIGLGGEIIVGWSNCEIIDRDGPDFTIFENAFFSPITNRIFIEPAIVSVSQDGINFIDFPFDSLTLSGCAGINPTYGDKNPYIPIESGGSTYDLKQIGLSKAKFIKIKDVTNIILNENHPLFDPIASGFDLDAVVALNYQLPTSDIPQDNFRSESTVIINDNFLLNTGTNKRICIYNYSGNLIFKSHLDTNSIIDLSYLPIGVYFYSVFSYNENTVGRFIKK